MKNISNHKINVLKQGINKMNIIVKETAILTHSCLILIHFRIINQF